MMSIDKSEGIGIWNLIAFIKENKYPKLIKKKEGELSDEEKKELKYFGPYYLTADDWDESNIDATLWNLFWNEYKFK